MPRIPQVRLSHSQIPAELKREYHVEAFRPPGCVLLGRPPLPVPPDTGELRVSSPSADRRFHRQLGAGSARASDLGAIAFSHRQIETIRQDPAQLTLEQIRQERNMIPLQDCGCQATKALCGPAASSHSSFSLLRRRHEASDETVYAHKHTRRDILPTLTTAHFETYTRLYTPACLSDDDANIPYAI